MTELSTAMECMNKSFDDCRDRLIRTGLSEAQAKDLTEVSFGFGGLMRVARNPGDAEVAPTVVSSVTEASQGSTVRGESTTARAIVRNVPAWIDHSTLDRVFRDAQGPEVGLGYTMTMPDAQDLEQLPDDFNVPSLAHAMVTAARLDATAARSQASSEMRYPDGLALSHELPLPDVQLPGDYARPPTAQSLHRVCVSAASGS